MGGGATGGGPNPAQNQKSDHRPAKTASPPPTSHVMRLGALMVGRGRHSILGAHVLMGRRPRPLHMPRLARGRVLIGAMRSGVGGLRGRHGASLRRRARHCAHICWKKTRISSRFSRTYTRDASNMMPL